MTNQHALKFVIFIVYCIFEDNFDKDVKCIVFLSEMLTLLLEVQLLTSQNCCIDDD